MGNTPNENWNLLITGQSDQFINGMWDALGLSTYYNANNYPFSTGGYFLDRNNSSKWVNTQFLNKYDGKTTKILDKWTMTLKVIPAINLVRGSSRDTFIYDIFYFAFSNVLTGGVFFAERKIKLKNVDPKWRRASNDPNKYLPMTWGRFITQSTNLNNISFSNGNISNWVKSYSNNAIYNLIPKLSYGSFNPISEFKNSVFYGDGVASLILKSNIPTGVKNINNISAYSGRWSDLLGGLIYNFTPQSTSGDFIKTLQSYNAISNYSFMRYFAEYNYWEDRYKITTENGIELKNRFFTPLYWNNDKKDKPLIYFFTYSLDNKTYAIDQINSEIVIYPIKIEKITNNVNTGGGSSNNNNSNTGGSSSTGGNSTSGGSAGGNSSNPSGTGGATNSGSNSTQGNDLISRFDAMKSGLWQKLKQSYVDGKDYYTDPDGNVYEIILLNGTDYLRKIDKSSLTTKKIDVTGKSFDCGELAFCNAKYKNCPQAIYLPEDYVDYNAMAKDFGGSYIVDGDYIQFANGKIFKNVGLTRPILCPEGAKAPPPIENTQTENLPCCIQKNDVGEYVYFYKGKTYPARKTTDNKYIADLGEGWRFIQDCIPVEPQKEPEPCDLYIKELSQLQEKNKSLQTEINKLREDGTSKSSMVDELNRLREENFQYEKDLITNYSPAREKELEVALKNAKDRISDLERELELTQNNNGEELNSHLDYCCECEYERNCCEY
jgi:uncharacterized membrane protein YgcG